ncbi:helix-turn-helix domain-containing protein [Macrococcoides bohemicum]|uniref:helix-turn-helix domain-containing protein n=1 Tax=Macrococcoides bohemicum TaxID=1903056 RepID=UPI0014044696|nr:helix-turn-helix transcriptional regulator [Macrococcus bohemicus]
MLGENIKKRRLELNMTQKALSNGICTQSQISKIEKNEIIPLSNLLLSIAKKLNISMDVLMGQTIDNSTNVYTIDKNLFDNLLTSRNYNMIETLLNSIDENKLIITDKAYYNWLKLLVLNIKNEVSIIDKLYILYDQYKNYIDNDMKINILNSIGIQARKEQKYKDSKSAFEKALGFRSESVDNKLIVKILYNMSNLLFDLKNWNELMNLLEDTMSFVYQTHQYDILPELIYSKYYCMDKLGVTYLNNDELTTAKYLAKKQMKYDVIDLLNNI